ncbi:MAG: methyltransferase domain-containing protein [Solirubrobacterales bacterium]|nr:methyltransferase domain-containing protein [Solirubrobacterales bacterium]
MLSFVCPVCHVDVPEPGSSGVRCPTCGRQFPDRDGAMDFTPNPPPDPDVQERWPLWEQLQHNFVVAADEIPEHSLSVGRRADATAFARFSDLRGSVLDVGCGPQTEPSYAVGANGRFVGIDPLRGEKQREFTFVQGIGEYLPFADGSFDRVLFATSLDHVLSPARSLSEARRVLSPSGTVNIWFGEVPDTELPPPATDSPSLRRRLGDAAMHPRAAIRRLTGRTPPQPPEPAYLRELAVPTGAIDIFHVVHLSSPLVSEWLSAAGLTVADAGRHGASVFLCARAPDASADRGGGTRRVARKRGSPGLGTERAPQ